MSRHSFHTTPFVLVFRKLPQACVYDYDVPIVRSTKELAKLVALVMYIAIEQD